MTAARMRAAPRLARGRAVADSASSAADQHKPPSSQSRQIDEDMEDAVTARHSNEADALDPRERSVFFRRNRTIAIILSGFLPLLIASAASAQYEPPKQMTLTPTGVDMARGRFTHRATDFSIGPFTLERSYIGGPMIDGSTHFGLNWTHNYSIYVVEKNQSKADGVYVVIGRNTVHFTWSRYEAETGFSCWNPDCMGKTLAVAPSGAIVYTDQQGNVYTFSPTVKAFPPPSNTPTLRNQRIDRIDYADGHTLTYTYVSGGSGQLPKLQQIASNRGYSLVFENNGPSGYISKACGYNRAETQVTASTTCMGAALAVGYGYAPATWVNLTTVKDALGQTWGYDYRGTSNHSQMTCVRQVNSTSCAIANNFAPTAGQTLQQTTADGAVWDIYYDSGKDPEAYNQPGSPAIPYGGSYRGPEGIDVTTTFGAGLLISYNANGRTTSLGWDGVQLASLTHPEGNRVDYSRFGEVVLSETWTPKPGSDLQPVSTSSELPPRAAPNSYFCDPSIGPKRCNKPIWRTDYKGNRTDYTYAPEHGGVLTETGPAVNGVRPQKRYTYVQSVASAAPPGLPGIWLVRTTAFCRTANFTNGRCEQNGVEKAGDEVVTTYDYEPKNLNLRSETVTTGGVSRRSCYSYDWQGNKISTTGPMGTCS